MNSEHVGQEGGEEEKGNICSFAALERSKKSARFEYDIEVLESVQN